MRKLISLLVLLVSFAGVIEAATGKCGKGLSWSLDNKGLLTISGKGAMNDYSKSGLPWRPELVKEVSLGEGITTIGKNAFAGAKISMIVLPSTVTSIGDNAFKGCRNLIGATLPYGLTTIGDEAFSGCRALVKLQIPMSVRRIGANAFANCTILSSLGLPDRLEAIGDGAFKGCVAIAKISSLPDYINSMNCRRYGLSVSAVENYLKSNRANSSASTVAATTVKPVESAPKKDTKTNLADVKYGDSDIDRNIPQMTVNNSRTFAFIFANENYSVMPDVPFAINDGSSFAAYCYSTLGIPKQNINTYFDATYGNMRAAMEYLKQVDETFKGEISVIVYYAGHGAPDEKTSDAYLVPTDAHTVNSKVCYPLEDLYAELGSLKAKSVKVFMDACFSGTDRSNDMLAQGGRLVATVPKKANVSGNVVVLSATSNDQTAWYHKEQGHGLFTYCLIKKLQETAGEVSMGELCDYLQEQVPQISIVQNRVVQSPTFQSSPLLGGAWRMWTVK